MNIFNLFNSKESNQLPKKLNSRDGYRRLAIKPDDVFLVSFPKSGNTWLRFLLGYYLQGEKCSFHTIDQIIPDIHYNADDCAAIKGPRFIKSHFPFSPVYKTADYPKVVYIVRDGRDVAVSYYYYLIRVGKLSSDISFDDALSVMNQGTLDPYSNWSMHVESWLDSVNAPFLLIQYEEMQRNTADVFRKVLMFSQVPIDQNRIAYAVEKSKFDSLKKKEQDLKSSWRGEASMQVIPFMREGKTNAWKTKFSDEAAKRYTAFHESAFKRLGYPLE